MPASDRYDLERFVTAQADVYAQVRAELRAGDKQSHWMWFIFPQIEGLGRSPMARKYAIASLAEAQTYLQHPLLGTRLRECTQLLMQVRGRSIEDILHAPDDMKFRSSMTLFAHATSDNAIFLEALQKYFGGKVDELTMQRIA